jgi:hypothetical protein
MICNCLPNETIPQTDQYLEATAKDHPQTQFCKSAESYHGELHLSRKTHQRLTRHAVSLFMMVIACAFQQTAPVNA